MKLPPVPSAHEFYMKGKNIGLLDVRFGIAEDELKLQSEWVGFRMQDMQRFEKDPLIRLLKGTYQRMHADEFLFRPWFKKFFDNGLPDREYSHGDSDWLMNAPKKRLLTAVGGFDLKIRRVPDDPVRGGMEVSSRWFGFQSRHEGLFRKHHMFESVRQIYSMLKERNAVRAKSGNGPDLFG